MSDMAYDIWVFDQLNPNERWYTDKKLKLGKRNFLIPFPEHLIGLAPEEIDQQERDRRNDEYLKLHGV